MKTPLLILSTDWHLKKSNMEEIKTLVFDQCQLALKHGLKEIYCLGDVFDSRISQRVEILICFLEILEICKEQGIMLICIPGNHDKTDYESIESFLAPYKHHPNLMLVEEYRLREIPNTNIRLHMIPYFNENVNYQNFLKQVKLGDFWNVLLSHIAVTGSVNNDGSEQVNILKMEMFKDFDIVFLGHFHNFHTLGNIIHIPSIKQHNFGENINKGYTIVFDDLTYEIQRSNFKQYRKFKIDLDQKTLAEIYDTINTIDTENAYNQIIFSGNKHKIKNLELSELSESGIKIKFDHYTEISKDREVVENVSQFSINDIEKLFQDFCDEFELKKDDGIDYLKNAVRQNSLLQSNQQQ